MVTAKEAKRLLSLHGTVRPQQASDWKGTIALPPSAERFYVEVGPVDITIESHGNPYFFPKLGDLWQFQAGYRWNGQTGKPIKNWINDWLVIADEGGNPFILSRSSGSVSHATHGSGKWEPETLFPDINAMAACLGFL